MKKKLPYKIGASVLLGTIMALVFVAQSAYAGNLSCSIVPSGSCTSGVIIFQMSATTNAHAEVPGGPNYGGNVVCCSGPFGLGNSCSTGATSSVLWLAGSTNAHSSQAKTNANYTNNACLSVGTGGTVSVGYQANNCNGFDTALGSMSAITNAHVGTSTAYSGIKICASATGTVALLNATGTVTSSVFDATASSTFNSIMWQGTMGTGNTGKVRFQFAASDCTNGATNAPTCNLGSWSYIGGATCATTDWFDPGTFNTPIELKGSTGFACATTWNNKRYFKYKVQICSNDCTTAGQYTPVVSRVVVNYAP